MKEILFCYVQILMPLKNIYQQLVVLNILDDVMLFHLQTEDLTVVPMHKMDEQTILFDRLHRFDSYSGCANNSKVALLLDNASFRGPSTTLRFCQM